MKKNVQKFNYIFLLKYLYLLLYKKIFLSSYKYAKLKTENTSEYVWKDDNTQ